MQKPLGSGDPRGFISGSKKAAAIINELAQATEFVAFASCNRSLTAR